MTSQRTDPGTLPPLARRLDALGAEGSFRVAAEARALEALGHEVIHLEFGEPDFAPPAHVVEAASRALHEGATKYVAPPGIGPLREAIASAARLRGIPADPDEVIVTSGAKPMLQYAFLALVDEGDDVLVPDPGFPIYPSLARLAGGVPRTYPIVRSHERYALDLDALAAAVTPRTRVLVLNSPHNPTGWVANAAELEGVAALVLKHNLWVIADDIYDGLTYGSAGSPSIASLPGLRERTIVVDGFSKRYAMTGFRLGFGIMPPDVARHVTALVINNTSCAPHFVQLAGLAALAGSQQCIAEYREEFRTRRDSFVAAVNAAETIRTPLPEGAFYAFTDVRAALARSGLTLAEVTRRLLHQFGVAALPGTDFGSGGDGFIRFSFAAAPALLHLAAERTRACIESLDPATHGRRRAAQEAS